jgi:glycosyltransferase involved in cell wall biosynthesis
VNIGISALYRASGGSLTHLVQLLREWHASGATAVHRFVLFCGESTRSGLEKAGVLQGVEVVLDPRADRGLLSRLWAEQIGLPRELRRCAIDVVFCPANVVPWRTEIPSVVVLQNAAPFCDSVTFRSLRGSRWWFRFRLLEHFARHSARRAAKVIFLSKWFLDLFVTRFGFDRERGVVIPHAGTAATGAERDQSFERSLGITRPYLLYVSHLNPYKNVLEVIRALASLRRSGFPDLMLVVPGLTNFAWYRREAEELVRREGLDGSVLLPGAVPHESVAKLLAGCEAFVFASTCENCPIAVIEALSAGVPVACSNAGVMPEVAGDGVDYFDADDPDDIARVLRPILSDPAFRAALRERARMRALSFRSEAAVAEETLAVVLQAGRSR